MSIYAYTFKLTTKLGDFQQKKKIKTGNGLLVIKKLPLGQNVLHLFLYYKQ